MQTPGYIDLSASPTNALEAMKGREVGGIFKDQSAGEQDIISIYFIDGSYITLTPDEKNQVIDGEILTFPGDLIEGYGGSFYNFGDLDF